MPPSYVHHADVRIRQRHVPRDAVLLVMREPHRFDVCNPGECDEHYRASRIFGRRELFVVWRDAGSHALVITVWWRSTRSGRRRRR